MISIPPIPAGSSNFLSPVAKQMQGAVKIPARIKKKSALSQKILKTRSRLAPLLLCNAVGKGGLKINAWKVLQTVLCLRQPASLLLPRSQLARVSKRNLKAGGLGVTPHGSWRPCTKCGLSRNDCFMACVWNWELKRGAMNALGIWPVQEKRALLEMWKCMLIFPKNS